MSRDSNTPNVLAPPPLVFLGAIAIGWGLQRLVPLPLPPLLGVAGQLAIGAGFLLILWAVRAFKSAGAAPSPYRPTAALVAAGPYRHSRNPIYVGFALVHLGIGLCRYNGWIVIMLLPALLVMRYGVIAREERYLEKRFGDDYRQYCNEVGRWF